MNDLWHKLGTQLLDLGHTIGRLLYEANATFPLWPLLVVWVAWWLLAVNWRKTWPVLAHGGWAPVVLLVLMAALVWSRVAPSDMTWDWLAGATVPNFWWQLVAVSGLAASALFCGWLQGVAGRVPPEISVEPPPAPAHDHGHAHH